MKASYFTIAAICLLAACQHDSGLNVSENDLGRAALVDMSQPDLTTDTGEYLPDLAGTDFTCPTLMPGNLAWVPPFPMRIVITQNGSYMYFPDVPNGASSVYSSWFADDQNLIAVSQACFDKLRSRDAGPFAVSYRPGSHIIRYLGAQDKLYVVSPNYTRCAISKEDAQALYKSAEPGGVNDTPVDIGLSEWPYFHNGAPIQGVRVHPGMLFQIDQDPLVFYVDKDEKVHQVTPAGFAANHFQRRFVRRVPNAAVAGLTVGPNIEGRVPEINDPAQGL